MAKLSWLLPECQSVDPQQPVLCSEYFVHPCPTGSSDNQTVMLICQGLPT